VKRFQLDPNNLKEIDRFYTSLQEIPDVAIFDTFIAEEKFSQFVHKRYP